MKLINYRLSEQVCLQCLIVALRQGVWEEWFSNPTAGPWKKLRIEGVGDEDQIRFLKEQERPDLITAHRQAGVILVIEAKDSIEKLLDPDQLRKSLKVFKEAFERLDSILSRHGKRLFPDSTASILPGYLFPKESTKIPSLRQLHTKIADGLREPRLVPHAIFEVQRDSKDNLHIEYQLFDAKDSLGSKIDGALPLNIRPVRDEPDLSRFMGIS